MMTDDMELLREYAASRSDSAFAELVSRHIGLVYSSALRQVRNQELAEEVTQAVFIVLARKAASLNSGTILGGWLHRTTRYVAANTLQAEFRRLRREREAYMDALSQSEPADPVWKQVSPLLDEALTKLGSKERDAVILRYFEGKSLAEVGASLGVEERAAQKRVGRALEKLRRFFTGRGVTLTVAGLVTVISANAVHAAPSGLAGSISVTVVKGSTVAASTLTLVKGALTVMRMAKLKAAAWIGAAVVVATGTGVVVTKVVGQSVVVQAAPAPSTGGTAAIDDAAWSKITVDALNALPPGFVLRPTHFEGPNRGGGGGGFGGYAFGGGGPGGPGGGAAVTGGGGGGGATFGGGGGGGGGGANVGMTFSNGQVGGGGGGGPRRSPAGQAIVSGNKLLARNIPFERLMALAYGVDPALVTAPDDKPATRYDVLMTDPSMTLETLQAEIQRQLGYNGRVVPGNPDVYVLTYKRSGAPGLTQAGAGQVGGSAGSSEDQSGALKFTFNNVPVRIMIQNLQQYFDKPIIDQSQLTGNYNVSFNVPAATGQKQSDAIRQAMLSQLGLDLSPSTVPLDTLVVEKAQ